MGQTDNKLTSVSQQLIETVALNPSTSSALQTLYTAASSIQVMNVDASGNSWIFFGSSVARITAAGIVTIISGSYSSVQNFAFDPSGNCYFTSAYATVYKVTVAGVVSTFATPSSGAYWIACDTLGNIFVSNGSGVSPVIYRYSSSGSLLTTITASLGSVAQISLDQSNNLYASDGSGSTNIWKYASPYTGTPTAWGTGPATLVYFDASGNGYQAQGSTAVYKTTAAGTTSTYYTFPTGYNVWPLGITSSGFWLANSVTSGATGGIYTLPLTGIVAATTYASGSSYTYIEAGEGGVTSSGTPYWAQGSGSASYTKINYLATISTSSFSWTFPSVPQGLTWTGTLSCPTAPTGAVFTATIGGVNWGQWGGNSVFGPVQAQSMQQLVVTATGLSSSQTYLLTWVGSSDASTNVASVWPEANSTALTAQISGTVATTSTITGGTLGSVGSLTSITNQVSTNAGGIDTLLASFGYTTLPATSSTFTAARNYLGFAMNFSGYGATVPAYIQITNVTQGTAYNWYKPSVYPADPITIGTSGGLWFCPLQANSGDTLQISALGTTGAATGNIELWGYVTSAQIFVEPAPNRSFDVVSYGGNVVASGNASATGSTTLLPAVTGYAYALHMVTCICSSSTETNNLFDLVTSGNPFYDGGLNVGTYNQFFYGMLVQSVTLSKVVTTTTQWNIHYALVRNPTII